MKTVHVHKLKITPERLSNLIKGYKKCEIRINDRDYQGDDILSFNRENLLRVDTKSQIADDEIQFRITHIHSGLGLEPGYVALSVERVC